MPGWTRGAAPLLGLLVFAAAPHGLDAQERGAIALGEAIQHLGVTTRVLMVGAHPDDEDTNLITWLQRGRGVETAYLSLTRGDGGQNLIGNELGEALGVIRTEELLAARRIDGARQYFTRAFDFGFSKDTIDTYKHWPRDSILGDVVRVVRAFRPHVIVAVFSGTTRDGHGHHQVSGLLARAAYDVSGDTVRFAVASHGAPWTVPKFYRGARGNAQAGTLGVDVGEYSPLLGRSYGEIAGESRSQHKSQGFGALQRKGPIMNYVRREASRVNESAPANGEQSMFDGIDTSWARFKPIGVWRSPLTPPKDRFAEGQRRVDSSRAAWIRIAIDSLPLLLSNTRRLFDGFAPERVVGSLAAASRFAVAATPSTVCGGNSRDALCMDFEQSGSTIVRRLDAALLLATGVSTEVIGLRELLPTGRSATVIATTYNRGRDTVHVDLSGWVKRGEPPINRKSTLPPGSVARDTVTTMPLGVDEPAWLARGRTGAVFADQGGLSGAGLRPGAVTLSKAFRTRGSASFGSLEPVTFRTVDAIRGEVNFPVVGAPLLGVTIDQPTQFVHAGTLFDRELVVRIRAADDSARMVRVTLTLPTGLSVDSATRTVAVARYDEPIVVTFRIRGRLSAGDHRIDAKVEWNGETFARGFELIDYEHIGRQRIYRPASIRVSAVDIRVPGTLRVAYVPGVGDNVAPALTQLGIPVTVIAAGDIARADLTPYTSVVIGPRAYEANPELLSANPKLFDFARRGGTLVVQYGQYEMTQPSATPFPITINRPHDRVTHEDTPVTIDVPTARELTAPNRIAASDFDGWVQERGLYMPRTFAPEYAALLSMSDTGEPPIRGGILVAPLGQGRYIYTSLAFFRQLPAGVPGAARLFVNLLSANLAPTVTP